ncbi:MAG: endonuclease/exonuclease/phosphatase family protein [Bacteroidota bacterium]
MKSIVQRYGLSFLIMVTALIFISPNRLFALSLIQSFAFQAMICYVLLAFFLRALNKKLSAYTAGIAGLALFLFLSTHVHLSPNSQAQNQRFSVAHFNVLFLNFNHEDIAINAIKSGADVVSFQEVTAPLVSSLKRRIGDVYPYHEVVHGENPSEGIALFSKYPLQNVNVTYWGDMPNILADVVIDDQPIHLVASHTKSPVYPSRYNMRNRHIKQITDYVKGIDKPVVAMGDYNAVPWDVHIRELQKQAGLEDSRRSLTPTFPAWIPPAQIPIDYIFYSNELECIRFDAIRSDSSDHLGIVGRYDLKKV